MTNMLKEHVNLIVCPDCKGHLEKIEIEKKIFGFYCKGCQIIFPLKDDTPIILARDARNFDLEYSLVKNIERKFSNNSFGELQKSIKRTLDLLLTKKDVLTWEWEDEEFWTKKYAKENISEVKEKEKWRYNDRIWQREPLVKELIGRLSLKDKTILSIGCGEGQNFRFLLSNYCDEKSLYIATDISFEALALNRSRNTHKNSLYILCAADYEFPFLNNAVDVLCYFGILHHTKNKSDNIQKDKRLVRKNGYIIIAEAIERPTLPFWITKYRSESSAHEERIRKKNLLKRLGKDKGTEVVFAREQRTPFFTGMITLFRRAMLCNRKLFRLVSYLDIITMTLGQMFPFLGGCEILLLARVHSVNPKT